MGRKSNAKVPRAKTLTRVELARALGCNPRTIPKWQEEGLPVALRGRGGRPSRYDETEVRAWLGARAEVAKGEGSLDWSQERARKEHWQALLAEQLHKARERELLPRTEVEKAWGGEVAAVRAKLLAWRTTLSDRITRAATLEGERGVERVLDEAVREVLGELAGGGDEPAAAKRRTRKMRAA